MIVTPPTNKKWQPDEPKPVEVETVDGLEVIVVVPGAYNGTNHKSLGMCKAGDRIVISPGTYADYLLENGLVTLPGGDASPVDSGLLSALVEEASSTETSATLEEAGTEAEPEKPKSKRKKTK